MRRMFTVALAAGLLAACGSDESEPDDVGSAETPASASEAASAPAPEAAPAPAPVAAAAPEMTTVGELGFELPFAIPAEIPAPADATYIGENPAATPYEAVQFATAMDAEALNAELEAFANATGANYDPSIRQVSYLTEIDGARYNVYAWVRTVEGEAILEVGRIAIPD
jgi:hypothetical protein